MGAPQIIYFILIGLGLGLSITKHGEYKEGKHNIVVDLIGMALGIGLLYWGGFFG
tara:strand:- start:32782 stop:32946 length:165 start_codon:yes stop_codon:yes gene_type:complete